MILNNRRTIPYLIIGGSLNTDGFRQTYKAAEEDRHITFEDENDDKAKMFHENVNSANCTCFAGKSKKLQDDDELIGLTKDFYRYFI